jgi:hypothetical protein
MTGLNKPSGSFRPSQSVCEAGEVQSPAIELRGTAVNKFSPASSDIFSSGNPPTVG